MLGDVLLEGVLLSLELTELPRKAPAGGLAGVTKGKRG
jgi:hypothetical protein